MRLATYKIVPLRDWRFTIEREGRFRFLRVVSPLGVLRLGQHESLHSRVLFAMVEELLAAYGVEDQCSTNSEGATSADGS